MFGVGRVMRDFLMLGFKMGLKVQAVVVEVNKAQWDSRDGSHGMQVFLHHKR